MTDQTLTLEATDTVEMDNEAMAVANAALALEANQDNVVKLSKESKRDTALFFIQEMRNDGAKRTDIVKALVTEMNISSANAAYYVDRVAPKA
jgi:hypothetical protein